MMTGLIKNNLKLMLRAKWILLFMTLMPVLFIALLGSVFDSMMDLDYTLPPFTAGYRMAADSKFNGAVEAVREICRENGITLTEFPEGDIEELITGGNAAVFVEITDERLTFYRHEEAATESAVMENILSTVFFQASEALTLRAWQAERGIAAVGPETLPDLSAAVSRESESAELPLLQSQIPPMTAFREPESALSTSDKLAALPVATDPVPAARDYYGIIEIVYFMWCGCISLSTVIPGERKNRIGARMRLTPATGLQLYLGKFIPCLLATLAELAAALLISVLLLDIHWGNQPGAILVLFFLALAATAFGMILFTLFSHIAVSIAVGWMVIFTNGFIGGSFMTYMYSILPDAIIRLAPQYYVNRTLVEFSTKGQSDYALPCLMILAMIFLVCVAIGLPLVNRREGSYV